MTVLHSLLHHFNLYDEMIDSWPMTMHDARHQQHDPLAILRMLSPRPRDTAQTNQLLVFKIGKGLSVAYSTYSGLSMSSRDCT